MNKTHLQDNKILHIFANNLRAMKFIALVLAYIGVYVASVNSECNLDSAMTFDPHKVQGRWYIVWSKPSLFDRFVNGMMDVRYDGSGYDDLLTANFFHSGQPRSYSSRWTPNQDNNTLNVVFSGLPFYNGQYAILATDYNTYLILEGCVAMSPNQGQYVILMRMRCPSKQIRHAVKLVLDQLNLVDTSFTDDPMQTRDCGPQ
ncbi:hypothetical protein L9F63_021121 [Diploptera punctata]|uniref:Uncharacterized protein n=1 Tax=Diploptera punctata TaxID=6984 RepID=A0AAD7ZQ16_DIPPU|nr:hypothetical protein L9F63_021121 [Diploptera punctata]